MWHRRIGLSEAGNDFFCSYFCVERDQSSSGYQAIYYPASSTLSCLGKCNLSWFTQLPQDRERKRNISRNSIVGQREFREIHREKERKATSVLFQTRLAVSICAQGLFVWIVWICVVYCTSLTKEINVRCINLHFADSEIVCWGFIMNIIHLDYKFLPGANHFIKSSFILYFL